jgi:hypothetical protein
MRTVGVRGPSRRAVRRRGRGCYVLPMALTLRTVRLAIVAGAVALPATIAAQESLTLLNYKTAVPAAWRSTPSSSSMRLAQFVVPQASGPPAAEVVVYFFGPGQGGGVEANLERWKGQFSNPDGSPVYEKVAQDTSGPFPITIAEYRGTYARGIGAGNDAAAKAGQLLIAVIAETPRGTLFFQLFGPIASAGLQREPLLRMVKGMR